MVFGGGKEGNRCMLVDIFNEHTSHTMQDLFYFLLIDKWVIGRRETFIAP